MSAPSVALAPRDERSPQGGRGPWLARAVIEAPDRVVALLFWTSIVVAVTVLVAAFHPWLVVPLLAVVVVATWRLMPVALAPTRSAVLGSLGALAVTAAWVVVHLPHVGRYVTVTRDPGFLTLEGVWLSRNADPAIPVGAAEQASAVPDVHAWTGAYFLQDGFLHAQGAKLLPGLLGLVGWVADVQGVLVGNLLIGAVALLAVYGTTRRVAGPVWGLVPVLGLATSMLFAAFSRSAYTEPLTLALAFGGLTFMWSAFTTRSWWQHVIASAMLAATALARIDGAAVVIGFVLGIGLATAVSYTPRSRRRNQVTLVLTTVTALLVVGLGYLDLRLHSPGYLADLGPRFTLLMGALVATVAFGVVVALPVGTRLRGLVVRYRRPLAVVTVALVAVVAVVLTSRPLWMVSRNLAPDTAYSNLVEGLQAREGLPVDPTRSYDEMTVSWLSWYHGWPMVVAAFVGLAILSYLAVRRRDPRRLLLVTVIGAPSALYLWRVSITPDHVWAMRRLLPLTVPGFLLCAAVTLAALWHTRRVWARALAVLAAAGIAIHPLSTWGALFPVAEQAGRLGEAQAVCAAVDGNPVVYMRGGGPPYLATIRTLCDVEVVEIRVEATPATLREVREAFGTDDLRIVAFHHHRLPVADGPVHPLQTTEISTWNYALSYIPDEPRVRKSNVYVGTVDEQGLVRPLPDQG